MVLRPGLIRKSYSRGCTIRHKPKENLYAVPFLGIPTTQKRETFFLGGGEIFKITACILFRGPKSFSSHFFIDLNIQLTCFNILISCSISVSPFHNAHLIFVHCLWLYAGSRFEPIVAVLSLPPTPHRS